ncbi:MAG: O-antigen ligase family protein [Elusimicrobia bacterium]|nr:O-antigen ligase family protein [Elusimicrobiota bacterium]
MPINNRTVLLIALCSFLLIYFGRFITTSPPQITLVIIIGIFISVVTLINPQFGLVILVFSMLLSPEIKIAEVPKRDVVIRIDDILLIVIFFTWVVKTAVRKELAFLVRTPLNTPILVYLTVCTLVTIKGIVAGNVSPLGSMFYILKFTEYFMVYFLVVNNLKDIEQVKQFLKAALITCIIVCIYAYFLGEGRASAPFETPLDSPYEEREPASLGGYLLIVYSVIFALMIHCSSMKTRIGLGAVALFITPPFFNSLSRASFMAFPAIPVSFLLLTTKRKFLVWTVIVLAVLLSPFYIPKKVVERVKYTFTGKEAQKVAFWNLKLEGSAELRLYSWKKVLYEWLPQKPFFGWGITGRGFIDSQYFRSLVELGILGFSVFIWLLVSIFMNAKRIYQNSENDLARGLALGFIGGFVALLIQAITTNTFIIVRIMEPFWFLCAIVMMLPKITKPQHAQATQIEAQM